ncbi:FHA domain-containing protein, partial [Streptomyces sp. SID14478]|uniref:FHA domain-containing protein n=1 Tax=Streptomyces sp. SID14478 TaxID=2706073 RepID=UPI0013D9E792
GGGVPQAFQQQPPAPPQHQQQPPAPTHPGPPAPPPFPDYPQSQDPQGPPPPPGPSNPSFGGGGAPGGTNGDDWVLSPPSAQSTTAPPFQQQPPQHQQYPPQQPQGPVSWSATIGPDREYFMAMMHRSGPEASGLNLPAYSPEQQRQLVGNQLTIGRRRHSTGDTPDIDLSVPPEDPGVSHSHAVLVQQPDGTWAVVDQNSTNGTTVNGGEEPIQPFVPVPLQDGDRVHVGAWTTITIHRG